MEILNEFSGLLGSFDGDYIVISNQSLYDLTDVVVNSIIPFKLSDMQEIAVYRMVEILVETLNLDDYVIEEAFTSFFGFKAQGSVSYDEFIESMGVFFKEANCDITNFAKSASVLF